jgi:hypothetical protein
MPIPPAIVDLNLAPIQAAPPTTNTGITNLVIHTPSLPQEISNMVLSSPPAEAPTLFTPSAPPNDGATWTTLSTAPTEGATWTSLGVTSASEPAWTPYQYLYTQPY